VDIDLAALTDDGGWRAFQCKIYREDAYVSKAALNSFIAASSRKFAGPGGEKVKFARRLLISASNNRSQEAVHSIQDQDPHFSRISRLDLAEAGVDWEALDKGDYGPLARTKHGTPGRAFCPRVGRFARRALSVLLPQET
jgi:predicted helicase